MADHATESITRSDVLILGAGFSRALSDLMPLTDELGNLCLGVDSLRDDNRVPPDGFRGGSFEAWLSQLADEQPYLSTEDNLQNQALFLKFSAAIANVLGRRVHDVLGAGWPSWFPELLRVADQRKATLITFNYDPLIECGVATGVLDEWGAPGPVFWAEVIGDVPSWPPGPMRWAADSADTFKLLKLHGSLNWYWSPGDVTGVSVARRALPGMYGEPEMYTESDRRRQLPGRVPFVVPPAATKSPYYRNPVVREIWQQAAASLRQADRVIIIGYLLPATDLTVAALIVDSLRDSNAHVLVVDIDPEPIANRLTSLGLPKISIGAFPARNRQPVQEFVARWRDEVGADLVRRLETSDGRELDDPLLIYWNRDTVVPITEVESRDDCGAVDLIVDKAGIFQQATRPRPQPLPTLRDVLARTKGRPLTVRVAADLRQTLIGYTRAEANVGYGTGRWIVLKPSGSYRTPGSM
jgi:hypothetical protein